METITWAAVIVAVLLGIAWYLSYNAARLDRHSLGHAIIERPERGVEGDHSGAG